MRLFDSLFGPNKSDRKVSSRMDVQAEAREAEKKAKDEHYRRALSAATQQMGGVTRHRGVNSLNTPHGGLRQQATGVTTNAPIESSYPMEGRGIRTARDIQEIGDDKLLVALLCDMVTSSDPDERLYAAMHKRTPMASVTMYLLSDDSASIRYLAEKRVEAWEEDERKQEILRGVDDGAY